MYRTKYIILPLILVTIFICTPFITSAAYVTQEAQLPQNMTYSMNTYFRLENSNPEQIVINYQSGLNYGTWYYPNANQSSGSWQTTQADFWCSFQGIEFPSGLDDLFFTFSFYLFYDASTYGYGFDQIENYSYGATNVQAVRVTNWADAGNFPANGNYNQNNFGTWSNCLWKVSFDFRASSGCSLIISMFKNVYHDLAAFVVYDQKMSYTYDDALAGISQDISTLGTTISNAISSQTAAMHADYVSLNTKLTTTNNRLNTISIGIDDANDYLDNLNTITENMAQDLDEDLETIQGYFTQTILNPDGGSYADYVEDIKDDINGQLQDISDFEDQLNAYINVGKIDELYDTVLELFPFYVRGLTFWGTVFDYIAIDAAPWCQLLIYCSIAIGLLGSVAGISFAFRRGIDRKNFRNRFMKTPAQEEREKKINNETNNRKDNGKYDAGNRL